MSKLKSLISNLYNRYMDEMDDYEELEDEYVENDLEEEVEYRARRAEKERRRQLDEERRRHFEEEQYKEEMVEDVMPTREPIAYEGTSLNSKASIYDYTKEGKVCCHCESSLERGVVSEKDQWGMSYTICPTCQFVNRIEPNGEPVYPSSEMAEMDHALALFAQKGYVFKGFNTKEEEVEEYAASL